MTVISFEQSNAAHTLVPKLFLQQITAESVGLTAMLQATNCSDAYLSDTQATHQ